MSHVYLFDWKMTGFLSTRAGPLVSSRAFAEFISPFALPSGPHSISCRGLLKIAYQVDSGSGCISAKQIPLWVFLEFRHVSYASTDGHEKWGLLAFGVRTLASLRECLGRDSLRKMIH